MDSMTVRIDNPSAGTSGLAIGDPITATEGSILVVSSNTLQQTSSGSYPSIYYNSSRGLSLGLAAFATGCHLQIGYPDTALEGIVLRVKTNHFRLANSYGAARHTFYYNGDAANHLILYTDVGSYDMCEWTDNGHFKMVRDNGKIYFGAGDDCSIYYDGTDMIANPKDVGTGLLKIKGGLDVEDVQIYSNSFTFSLTASASNVSVTFPVAFAVGITPVVVCTPPYQTSFWVTSISNTGFTFNVGTTNGYAQTINCIAMATS
jgi:hypothetical protein